MAGDERDDPRPARSRALLVDAATRLLERGGVGAVTVDAVTAESGVARATLFRNFGTTAELMAAAFERLLPVLDFTAGGTSLREDLCGLLTAQAALVDHVPLHVTMLAWLALSPESSPGLAPGEEDPSNLERLRLGTVERYKQPFSTLLTGDLARAQLRPDTFTEAGVGEAVAQLTGPLIFNRLIAGTPSTPEVCHRIVDDFLRAHSA